MKAFRTRCNLLRSALLIFLSLLAAALPAAETVTYYHTDALGSIVAATDEQGAVLWRESYRPYGERTVPTSDHRLFYTGKPHDDATGFTYFGARYYDPLVGRFIGMDPVEVDPSNPQSFSRYGYANDNPYRFWDPDGMESEEVEEYLQAPAEYTAQVRKVGENVYKTAEGAAGFANPVVGAVQGYSEDSFAGAAIGALRFGKAAKRLAPSEDNFSQRTVSGNVEQYVRDMKAGNWDWSRSGPIRIMQQDGKWVSYHSRRLMAAQQAGLKDIPFEVVDPKLPLGMPRPLHHD